MIKFTYKNEDSDSTNLIIVRTEAPALPEVLESFKDFLRAVGYHEDNVNSIQIVEEEDE